MGWASGSVLMSDIIDALVDSDVKDTIRIKIYKKLISCFENYDCDTLSECIGEDVAFDIAFREKDPEYSKEREFDDWYYSSLIYANTTDDADEETKAKLFWEKWSTIWSLNKAPEDIVKEMNEEAKAFMKGNELG